MATVNVYLTFNGNCEEAFGFYKTVFGGDFQYIGRYGEMPTQGDVSFGSDDNKEKIMHITLPISAETMLMGNDSLEESELPFMSNTLFSISIKADSRKEADQLFGKLSEGGQVTLEMRETFWGSYYGMITDKFGINWRMSVDLNQ
jgi:PhnB protein